MTTNYERIKNMTVEEMTELLASSTCCDFCRYAYSHEYMCDIAGCKSGTYKWLQAESEE